MGMWGERVEDVVYFMEPGYVLEGTPYQISIECTQLGEDNSLYLPPLSSAAHRDFLPSAALGYSSNRALLIISGSGIKEGVKIEKTVNLVDVAPTISYLLGISPPDNAEGRVLHEFLL
ncbi:TPA: hypothetical protein EYP75_03995 [Candidatus Bathyarchaeota archaeon]|nr:hypothetical protein [Candidatus Bathyarchaeota archaeon]